MNRRAALMAALTVAGLAAPARGAESTMYPDDPQRQFKEQVEDVYGLFILLPSRRHFREKVEINGDTAHFDLFIDPIKPDFDKVKCDAIKWVLLGRFPGGSNGGAQPFFAQFPRFSNVDLELFRLLSSRQLLPDGSYKVEKRFDATYRVRISRSHSERLDWANVKATLEPKVKEKDPQKAAEACRRAGEKLVDKTWSNPEYFR